MLTGCVLFGAGDIISLRYSKRVMTVTPGRPIGAPRNWKPQPHTQEIEDACPWYVQLCFRS